jgi:hypothetical protein
VACASLAGDDVIARAAEDVDLWVGAFLDPRHGEKLAAPGADLLAEMDESHQARRPGPLEVLHLVPDLAGLL